MIMFIHFCCSCPLGLTFKLNFNILKGPHYNAINVTSDMRACIIIKMANNLIVFIYRALFQEWNCSQAVFLAVGRLPGYFTF